ncbi:hypothetical protein A1O3_10312 [Capronia epimyces CBS 606.96]|uniref:Amine oxidase domain-containing protein n=1 Tax=Capronia epimyces CBS 606.96 TaxID=1182542 RepID=W9Y3V5_9EURO|nr:uncharacterized protein A1O3_10312 [Capronia epimyces CBS 606.96]EXJ77154.1 hypothetical protein A1O3_10312 [Capronia epimyces CBS 606.96]
MQALRHAGPVAQGRTPHVAVVGAGVAGLRCSDVLARAGVRVTVLEARNRIGGRVHQGESGGHLVDMGPNWIHGTKGNPIMGLAEKTGTKVMEPEEEGALFDTGGIRRSDAEAVDLSSKIWEMVVGAFKHSDDHSATIDPQTSLFDYFKSQLAETETGVDSKKRQDLLHEAQMWGPFVGDPVEKQSLKFFFLEECIEGENVFVAGTYKDILREIGRTATDPAKVDLRLETEVVHFDTTAPSPAGAGAEHKVTVRTATGETLTFDEVVITCPLGWLKRNHTTAFAPALPPRLSAAIEHINYGRLEKLHVTFPTAFWLSQRQEQQHQHDEADPKHKHKHRQPLELSTYPIFTHFHDPSYIPHAADEAWNQSVVSLAHLPSPHAHPTLLFYMYGPCATHVVRSVQGLPPHSAEYNAVLTAFAEPFYSRLPHYSAADPSCTPTSLLMTQWQADRFAGNGSYCNFQVGLERGDEDIEVMRAAGGISSTRGLWLAGEHTAPFIALGTTTGAWWSGEGVARRICAAYGVDVPEDAMASAMAITGHPDLEEEKKVLDASKPDAANLAGLAI